MRKSGSVIIALLLAACAGGAEPIDAKKFLSEQDGPKVPTMQESLVESAQNAEKAGDYPKAAQMYQQALEKDKGNKELLLALAESCRRGGDNDNAIVLYNQLLDKDPTSLAAKEGKALAMVAKGDFVSPVAPLSEVMLADPTRWKTLNAFGIILTTQGRHDEAEQYFNLALQAHPDSPAVLNNMGLSQALGGKNDTAIATLTRASELSAAGSVERKRIDLNTALVYASVGKLDDANAVAKQYLSGSALDNNMGMYAHLAKDDTMARDYLNMALTDSKVFYSKAWDNLQDISRGGTAVDTAASADKSSPNQE